MTDLIARGSQSLKDQGKSRTACKKYRTHKTIIVAIP